MLELNSTDIDAAAARLAARQAWQRPQYEGAAKLLKNIRVNRTADGRLVFHERRPVEVITAGLAKDACTCQTGYYMRCVHRLAAEIIAELEAQAGATIPRQPAPDEHGPAGAVALLAREVGA